MFPALKFTSIMGAQRFLLLVCLFLILGVWISFVTPYPQFPDEQSHFAYARWLKIHGSLPPLSYDVRKIPINEGFQPPLYYFLASFLVTPAHESASIHRVRLFSLFLGLMTVFFVWKSARLVFTANANAILLTAAFSAMNPQFIFTVSGVSNISMMFFTCATTIYLATWILADPRGLTLKSILLGVSCGCALLSRTITAFLFPICLLAIWLVQSDRKAIRPFLFFICSAALVSAWWYVRNWIDFGDPLLWKLHATTVGAEWVRNEPLNWFYLLKIAAFLHASYWAYFGLNQWHAGIVEYAVYLFLELVAVIGIFEIYFSKKEDLEFQFLRRNKIFPVHLLTACLGIAEIFVLETGLTIPQGRYLYVALTSLSLMMAAGFTKIVPARYRSIASVSLTCFLSTMCLYLLLVYWLPY